MNTVRFEVLAPDGPLHEQALDHTFPQWNDALTREQYGKYNRAQLLTPWGSAHLQRVGLVMGSDVVASAKRYRLRVRVDGRTMDAVGIGALFTPPARRGLGHASVLIQHILDAAAAEGASLGMLFSEIPPSYYERLGFSVVPAQQAVIGVRTGVGAPAVLMRSGEPRDLDAIAAMHRERAGGYRFSLEYDVQWLHYTLAKKRMLSGFGPPGTRDVEFFVCEEGSRAVAWVLLQVSRRRRDSDAESWSLSSGGDRDPSGSRIGAMLQALVARTPGARPPVIHAWWPAGLDPPQLAIHRRRVTASVLMRRPLREEARVGPPFAADDVLFWHADAF